MKIIKTTLIAFTFFALTNCNKSNNDSTTNPEPGIAGQITTLAGTGAAGNVNGPGATAQFSNLFGVCVDSNGNVFVVDRDYHCVKKITPAGVVSLFAGSASGELGSTDSATGTDARFYEPNGICIDSNNNLFVADNYNHCIRKITPAGAVSTFCGQKGTRANDDLTGELAGFSEPQGICIDNQNNMYVAEGGVGRIRKITPTGVVTTLAGVSLSPPGSAFTSSHVDGVGTNARFTTLIGAITTDNAGNLYVGEFGVYNSIRKIVIATKNLTTIAGNGEVDANGILDDGIGINCKAGPSGMCFDGQGNIMFTSYGSVRKLNLSDTKVTTISRNPNQNKPDGNLNDSGFTFVSQIAYRNGKFYVTEDRKVRILTLN